MHRRTVLSGCGFALTAGLAGCVISSESGTEGENGDDEQAMKLTLESADTAVNGLSFTVDVFNHQLSLTEVPKLNIEVENVTDESLSWGYGGSSHDIPFPQAILSDPNGLVIGRVESIQDQIEFHGQSEDIDEGCNRIPGFDRDDGFVEVNLEPDEKFESEYAICTISRAIEGGCPEPGRFRFEYDYSTIGICGFDIQLE